MPRPEKNQDFHGIHVVHPSLHAVRDVELSDGTLVAFEFLESPTGGIKAVCKHDRSFVVLAKNIEEAMDEIRSHAPLFFENSDAK